MLAGHDENVNAVAVAGVHVPCRSEMGRRTAVRAPGWQRPGDHGCCAGGYSRSPSTLLPE